jgi:hypothetical protein
MLTRRVEVDKWWKGYPWRMIQTNMREIDMLDIDAERFVAELQAFKATVVLVNAAGIIASYPTKLPFHFQSPYLKGDSLADIIEACHRADIRVLARTDFSKVRRPIYEAHPDWAYRTVDGEIIDYNGDVHACINGDYQQIYALEIIRELITTHDVDGIFFNMGGYQTRDYSRVYYGLCHCQACQRRFAEMYELALPCAEDMGDPVYRRYNVFRRRTVEELNVKVASLIHELRPDMCVDKDFHRGTGFIRQESNTAVDRPLPHWQYSASANTKWAVATYPNMVSSNTTVDFIDFPYRHVAVSPHQQKLRLAQNLANGGALDYYLIGRLDNHEDQSGYESIKEMFYYHAAHEAAYRDNVSKATIALLDNSRNRSAEARGWFRFLAEGHFLFDTPQTDTALQQSWDRYDAILLPDLRLIGDALARKLDDFVAAGGTLIAAGQSGFYGTDYERRPAPALQCLGIANVDLVREDIRARPGLGTGYFKLDDKTGFPRFAQTDLIYFDGPYLYCQYVAQAVQRLKLVPPHNYGPPERCYYETTVDRPGLVVHPWGKGQAIYIPWLPGQLFHRQGHTNTFDFISDLLEHVAGLASVGGNLSPMVEVTLFGEEQKRRQLLQLVNSSGHFGTTFYAPVPMHDVKASIPYAAEPRSVTSLVTGEAVPFEYAAGTLTVTVPVLELFEALQIA